MSNKLMQTVSLFVMIFIAQKSGGKTMVATLIADLLTLNAIPFRAFQVDDQKRLSHMIGETVVDLRPNPDLLIDDPTIAVRALTPFYDSVRASVTDKAVTLLDTGANEVENVTNFLSAVDFATDIAEWNVPAFACVPFYPLDPESTAQAAFTVGRLREAVPNIRLILIENRHLGSAERIVAGSIAEANYADLLAKAASAERIVMPMIHREYWAPFEGSGIRFLKALAMDPEDGARRLGRSVGEIKIMKSAIARFWRQMHAQFSRIIDLPEGGE